MSEVARRAGPGHARYDEPVMRHALTIFESARLGVLALTLPYAWAWGEGSGAPLLTAAFGLLVLLHLLTFDSRTILGGGRPRFGLTRDRDLWSPAIMDRARFAVVGLLALVIVLLVFVSFRGAVVATVAAMLIAGLTGGVSRQSGRWRMLFAEVLWPALMLVAPMVIFGWLVAGPEDAASAGAGRAATGVGALVLAVYVLICELRDEAIDGGEGWRTLATLAGRSMATLVLFLVLAVLLIATSRGAGLGVWEWWVPAIAGIASLLVTWAVASDAIDGAPALWAAAGFVIAIGVV